MTNAGCYVEELLTSYPYSRSSVGAACVIGQLAAGGALLGADSAAHMSEEVICFSCFPDCMYADSIARSITLRLPFRA